MSQTEAVTTVPVIRLMACVRSHVYADDLISAYPREYAENSVCDSSVIKAVVRDSKTWLVSRSGTYPHVISPIQSAPGLKSSSNLSLMILARHDGSVVLC